MYANVTLYWEMAIPDSDWAAAHKKYTHSALWKKVRAPIIVRANGHCERCGKARTELQVHHLTYERMGGGELPSDLQAICGHCHLAIHGRAKGRKKPKPIRMGPRPPKGYSRIRKKQERLAKKAWSDARKDALAAGLVKNGGRLIDPAAWTPPNRSQRR